MHSAAGEKTTTTNEVGLSRANDGAKDRYNRATQKAKVNRMMFETIVSSSMLG
jgi:hypothetical protein